MDADTIGGYLIRRLRHYGVRHCFGIPGDYVLGFYDLLQHSRIEVVGTAKEDGAGFAADGYARVNGIGACCITYCVGGLGVANAIAGAYAEKSPVVVISGAPGLAERGADPMLHHKVKNFDTQLKIFDEITAGTTVLDDDETAFRDIDRILALCDRSKRPVYVELPRDMVDVVPRIRERGRTERLESDPESLRECVDEISQLIAGAANPVILAGVEVHRYGIQGSLRSLVDRTGIPIAVTLLGKSVISELHPRYLGVYEGAMGREEVARAVEGSDCVLMLGAFMTDVNLGVFTAKLDRSRCIQATSEFVQVKHHRYLDLRFEEVVGALARADLPACRTEVRRPELRAPCEPGDSPLRVAELFARLDALLEDDMAVVCDVGLCLFGAVDLVIHRRTEFIAPAYYTSMGFGIPASVGVGKADPALRTVVLVGDGAFQMTGNELSTVVAEGQDPIVILLDNDGYTTERVIKDGPYNDLHRWRYERFTEVLGAGRSWRVTTEREFVDAWNQALASRDGFSLICATLARDDISPSLERLGKRLAERIGGKG